VNNMSAGFAELYAAALAVPLSGWSFDSLGDRLVLGPKPWEYHAVVRDAARGARVVVDLGTGGGEFWSSLELPNDVQVATECWAPNVAVAAACLRPRGVHVLTHPSAPDNLDWAGVGGDLPFRASSIDLLHSRHESYAPPEVARVLARDGRFVTQQVGSDPVGELADALGAARTASGWTFSFAVRQLEAAGLRIVDGAEALQAVTYADVGAVVQYARMVPWAFPGFDVHRDVDRLEALHERMQRDGGFTTKYAKFWLRAEHA
jgi:hypothetical protein